MYILLVTPVSPTVVVVAKKNGMVPFPPPPPLTLVEH